MGIFSSNKISYLGVDIGTSSIKVVELASDHGRPRLVTYGFTERKMADVDKQPTPEELAAAIVEVCGKSRTTSKKVVTALPNFSVFTSIITLPYLSKKELSSAITWEAKKLIPTPLEDIILDWKIVEELTPADATVQPIDDAQVNKPLSKIFAKPKKNLKILLTGASKNLVKKYISIFATARLSLLSLETENFALIRSLIGDDKSTIMVIDLGASTSSIAVIDKGVPILTRSLELGGLMITRAISTSLNVNLERAEQFKQDLSLDVETAENALPQTVERAFAGILNEIKYTVNLYQDQHHQKIEKIIVTGGSGLLGHLPGYISTALNITTYIGDPWARVIFPTELKPVLDRLGPRFAVAIGLAMRNIE
jgi:type IV pilus assembly protein PilM